MTAGASSDTPSEMNLMSLLHGYKSKTTHANFLHLLQARSLVSHESTSYQIVQLSNYSLL